MFIEQTSVDLSKNKFENITLVWDMNKLFEEFVYELIKRKIPECKPKAQKTKRLLVRDKETRRNTKVDIFIQKPQVIIDTKVLISIKLQHIACCTNITEQFYYILNLKI